MPRSTGITRVEVRMYCLGTGDCFALKFFAGKKRRFTLLIDCGSCQGDRDDFEPYVKNLLGYVENKVDLLVVTHEHNDHVNGFHKCAALFEKLEIGEAWFAWTEEPGDPDGFADDLLHKRNRMRLGLHNAIAKVKEHEGEITRELKQDFNNPRLAAAARNFIDGLKTLTDINLAAVGEAGAPLPGMLKIKALLAKNNVPIKYLRPGAIEAFRALPGVKFHVLGPPTRSAFVHKEGKQGSDVFKNNFSIGESILALNAFTSDGSPGGKDYPFSPEYFYDEGARADDAPDELKSYLEQAAKLVEEYKKPDQKWRTVGREWLYTAGSLALRLDKHINNTSLVLAAEIGGKEGDVLLLPGDAEYGSWESWHLIDKWKTEGKGGKPLAEDLLNRTIFYKVGHHLSYNGTARERGILMMNHPNLAAMATLDRSRIASKWKSTMPNHELLKELVSRTGGRCFIMDETDIADGPSRRLDPANLGSAVYEEGKTAKGKVLYKQYVVSVNQH